MSHWNNRVCKQTQNGVVYYDIREVYYVDREETQIYAVTENAVGVFSELWDSMTEEECLDEMREVVKRFERALDRPILDIDTIKFASREEDEDDD